MKPEKGVTSVSPQSKSVMPLGHESDADSEGEAEGPQEAREVKVKKAPSKPSQQEVEAHMATGHVIFRSWCDHCVRGQAVEERHPGGKREESEVPIIAVDYSYFGSLTKKGGKESKGRVREKEVKKIRECP